MDVFATRECTGAFPCTCCGASAFEIEGFSLLACAFTSILVFVVPLFLRSVFVLRVFQACVRRSGGGRCSRGDPRALAEFVGIIHRRVSPTSPVVATAAAVRYAATAGAEDCSMCFFTTFPYPVDIFFCTVDVLDNNTSCVHVL